MARSSLAEAAARVDTIMTLLLRGASRADVIQFSAEKWNISDRQVDVYISRANRQIAEIQQPRRAYEYALIRTRLEQLYKRTFDIQDYKTALSVLKQIADLTGHNAPVKLASADGDALSITIRYEDGGGHHE